ncbi:Mitochondrial ribosome small subunit biogenesis protein [Rhizina undulata]
MLPRIIRLSPRLRRFSPLPYQAPALAAAPRFVFQPRYHSLQSEAPASNSHEVVGETPHNIKLPKWTPPEYCPGCGAPSQHADENLPGHYPKRLGMRKMVKLAGIKLKSSKAKREEDVWKKALEQIKGEADVLRELGVVEPAPARTDAEFDRDAVGEGEGERGRDIETGKESDVKFLEADPQLGQKPLRPSLCTRCHSILHHHSASPLPSYPTLQTLTNLILESKHRKNHIYHLLDAADLPMSLKRGLKKHLYENLPREIRKNLSISYVVTRADLLMPGEGQISSLMTWIKKVVKDALPGGEKVEAHGPGEKVHAISVRRGWGVGIIKQEIKEREGAAWILGKVNVGKSRFVGEVWPEGGQARPVDVREAEEFGVLPKKGKNENEKSTVVGEEGQLKGVLEKFSKVVPEQVAPAPVAAISPTVSDVPGTTAAPIRVSFKTAGRGGKVWSELIDLPGLESWVGFGETGLLKYVRPEKQKDVMMETIIKHQQHSLKSGQTLLLGGLIAITIKTPRINALTHPFTALPAHVTANKKVFGHLTHPEPSTSQIELYQKPHYGLPQPPPESESESASEVELPHFPPPFSSAGTFKLTTDVTAQRSPHLWSKSPEALEKLPYKVMSTDILLEGIGWVEIAAQVRNREIKHGGKEVEIEVWTPDGRGVGQRVPMGAFMTRKMGAMAAGLGPKGGRPRQPMKGAKKTEKRNMAE